MINLEENRTDVAKYFSDICRNSGKVSFKVTYTATEGNILVDKEFQEFCFKNANNEYLSGISLLLASYKHYEELKGITDYLEELDSRITIIESKLGDNNAMQKEEKEIKEKPKEIKTF